MKAQLDLSLFLDAKKTISQIDDDDMKIYLRFELADALWKHGETAKSDQIREQTDKRIPDIVDRYYLWLLLRAAVSYHTAGEKEKCRKRLRDGMTVLQYSESDFHDDMAEVAEVYYNCDCLHEFIEDIQQYRDEDIDAYIYDAKKFLEEKDRS